MGVVRFIFSLFADFFSINTFSIERELFDLIKSCEEKEGESVESFLLSSDSCGENLLKLQSFSNYLEDQIHKIQFWVKR